jgi:hypothetical protein
MARRLRQQRSTERRNAPSNGDCGTAIAQIEPLRLAQPLGGEKHGLVQRCPRHSLNHARPDGAGHRELDGYRALIVSVFDSSPSPKLSHDLARLSVRRPMGDADKDGPRSPSPGDFDAEWLRSGAEVRLISGHAGTGKSTLLRFLVGQAARGPLLAPLYVQGRRVRTASTKPFFLAAPPRQNSCRPDRNSISACLEFEFS